MTFAEKIKKIRWELRMSQNDLASILDCNQSVISAYEAGQKKPSYDNLVKLDQLIKKHKLKMSLL